MNPCFRRSNLPFLAPGVCALNRLVLLTVATAALCAFGAAHAAPVQRDHVEVELVSERDAVAPGERVHVGLRLAHEPHWHTYWINAGDSGLATKLKWTLPDG